MFHSLDGDLEFQGHEYIVKLLTKKTKEIEEMYDVRVVAGVGDNASVMDKSLAEFAQTRPFFVHHCSAHWVQLILNDISENALVQKSMDACARIRSIFNKKVNLKTLQDVCKALRKSITRLAWVSLICPRGLSRRRRNSQFSRLSVVSYKKPPFRFYCFGLPSNTIRSH